MFRMIGLLAAMLTSFWATDALAQAQAGDPAAGKKLATAHCSTCHAVDGSESNRKAPSFAAVARMPSTTSLSLHAFLLTPHPTMPNYKLEDGELDDVVAYILSLPRH